MKSQVPWRGETRPLIAISILTAPAIVCGLVLASGLLGLWERLDMSRRPSMWLLTIRSGEFSLLATPAAAVMIWVLRKQLTRRQIASVAALLLVALAGTLLFIAVFANPFHRNV